MSTPNISIILPVFNGEKYLRESLDSVLSQGYKDFELIIWNDGSTDGTAKILMDYRDARIKVFGNTVNQGLFKTLNLAIKRAQGRWIRLWSYDDIMKPYCLQTEIEFQRQHPEVGMSYCAYDAIDESGKVLAIAQEDETPDIISSGLAAQIMFYHGSIAGNIATAMLKKEVLDITGLFREDMAQSADFEMWVRISAKYPLGFLRNPLIYLRRHINQFSRWKGMGAIFIKEDGIVIQQLMKRLPPAILRYAKVYNRWHRYIIYVQYMMHCLLSGDFKTAAEVYRDIRDLDNPFLLMGLWFISANGRWFKKKPKFIE